MKVPFRKALEFALWKNFHVMNGNMQPLITSVTLALVLGFFAIGLRMNTDILHTGIIAYPIVDLKAKFSDLVSKVESRRSILMQKTNESFYHSDYVPQLIIAFGGDKIDEYQPIITYMAENMAEFNLTFEKYQDCETMKRNFVAKNFLFGICFKPREHAYDLDFSLITHAAKRMHFISDMFGLWDTNSNRDFMLPKSKTHIHEISRTGGSINEGITYIQNMVANAHLKIVDPTYKYRTEIVRYTRLTRRYDTLLEEKSVAAICTVLLGFLFPSVFVVFLLVMEKETGVRGGLKAHGIGVGVQLLAWVIILWGLTAFNSLISALIFNIGWKDGYSFYTHTSFLFLLLFLLSYCFANASFCIMVSAICSSIHKAIPLVTLMWLMTFMLFFFRRYDNPFAEILGLPMILFPNSLAANVMQYAFQMEKHDLGLGFKDLFNFNIVSQSYYTLLLSGVLFFLIGWGLDNFKPGLYGKRFDWQAFKALFGVSKIDKESQSTVFRLNRTHASRRGGKILTIDKEITIIASNISKSFKSEVLFDCLNLSLRANELVLCVGANNTGKTVLSLILAGLMKYDSGVVKIGSAQLLNKPTDVRNEMGLAIGMSLLSPELTFMEQLIFFSQLNGISAQNAYNYAHELVAKLHFEDFYNVKTMNLPVVIGKSLAVFCAFSGNKPYIVLDTVCSAFVGDHGIEVCNFVNEHKKDRTVFMTAQSITHWAQIADRILILDAGCIVWDSPPEEMKTNFNEDVVLSCKKRRNFNAREFKNLVRKYIPEATTFTDALSPDIAFSVHNKDGKELLELLDEIESRKYELGLDSFVVKLPTYDDFVRYNFLESEIYQERYTSVTDARNTHSTISNRDQILHLLVETRKLKGCKLFFARVSAFLHKQFFSHSVNVFSLIFYISIPLIFCLYCLTLSEIFLQNFKTIEREMNITKYDKSFNLISTIKKLDGAGKTIIRSYKLDLLKLKNHDFLDIGAQNIADVSDIRIGHNLMVTGVHVKRRLLLAKFSMEWVHSASTSLAQLHSALIRHLTRKYHAKMKFSLAPLETKHPAIIIDENVLRFLSFCLSLGLWFVFGLSSTGITFNATDLNMNQHSWGLDGAAFWIGYSIVIVVKLLIVIPIVMAFLMFSSFKVLISPASFFDIIVVIVLGAFYFNFVKAALLSFFNRIERRNSISIFLTILATINYNFAEFCNESWTPAVLFLPLNMIGTFLFYIFLDERSRHFCLDPNVYDISVYVENCNTYPSCCDNSEHRRNLNMYMFYVFIIVIAYFCITLLLTKLIRLSRLHMCTEVPRYKSEEIGFSDANMTSRLHIRKSLLDYYPTNKTVLLCDNVGKQIGKNDYLNNITFKVQKGECLAITGKNYAEKNMLLRVICGNVSPSYGRVFFLGKNPVRNGGLNPINHIGFCLLHLPRIHLYKVGQYMEVYAQAVGIPRGKVREFCRSMAAYMDIIGEYDKLIAIVSKSTLRRMIISMAFFGFPEFIILELNILEHDFQAQYLILKLINWYLDNGGAMILCLPLATLGHFICTHIGFLDETRMAAFGSLSSAYTHLADGYEVEVTFQPKALTGGRIHFNLSKLYEQCYTRYYSFMENSFVGCKFRGRSNAVISYYIPRRDLKLSQVYEAVVRNAEQLSICRYTISFNTTETVYENLSGSSKVSTAV